MFGLVCVSGPEKILGKDDFKKDLGSFNDCCSTILYSFSETILRSICKHI